jgi:hypothetical protein
MTRVSTDLKILLDLKHKGHEVLPINTKEHRNSGYQSP